MQTQDNGRLPHARAVNHGLQRVNLPGAGADEAFDSSNIIYIFRFLCSEAFNNGGQGAEVVLPHHREAGSPDAVGESESDASPICRVG